ncbi:hypothetical protein JCM9957A_16670 [Kineosporia succinea]
MPLLALLTVLFLLTEPLLSFGQVLASATSRRMNMSGVAATVALCVLAGWISWLAFCYAVVRHDPDRAKCIPRVAAIVRLWRSPG